MIADSWYLLSIISAASIALILTFRGIPGYIDRFIERGFIARDMYKAKKHKIADNGGILILYYAGIAFFLTLIAIKIILQILETGDIPIPEPYSLFPFSEDFLILFTIGIFALFGMLDDFLDISKPVKAVIPIVFSIPLAIAIAPNIFYHPWGSIDLGGSINIPLLGDISYRALAAYIIIPVYIMVVANLVNMHSGFNGLQSGCSFIILLTIIIKSVSQGSYYNLLAAAILGSLFGFLWYNKYPARIFEGNIGSMIVGATIGAAIVTNHFFISGIIMLIPHIVNFVLYLYWRIVEKKRKDKSTYKLIKFGGQWKDGSLRVRNALTLKWILPYFYRLDERQSVMGMWVLTFIFCMISIPIPY